MSSVLCLRDFVNERLTAAAEEILTVFEKTIVVYEEELSRQRSLLDAMLKPQIKLHRTEFSHSFVCNEEENWDQQDFCNQESNSSLDHGGPAPPQIKQEQEELCSEEEEDEQPVLNQESDLFKFRPTCEESDHHREDHNNISVMVIKPEPDREGSGVSEPNSNRRRPQRDKSQIHKSGNTENSSTDEEPETNHFKCPFCTEEFSDNLKLKLHMKSHTGEKRFKCDTCGKGFTEMARLRKHLLTHTGLKPFRCKVCGKEFNCQSNRVTHMKTHTDEKPYTCVTCGKGFSRGADLKRHNRTHTGEKPYSCIYCGREFPYHTSLKNHVRVHTGEKPFECMWCGKRFAVSATLRIHTRIHTGERPYECSVCGKTFAHNTGLTLHMKIHAR